MTPRPWPTPRLSASFAAHSGSNFEFGPRAAPYFTITNPAASTLVFCCLKLLALCS